MKKYTNDQVTNMLKDLTIGQFLSIILWDIFQPYKAERYFERVQQGMIKHIAFKEAKTWKKNAKN